jgi:hypothetical protein
MVMNVMCLLKVQRMLHGDETQHAFHVWYVFIGWFNYRTTTNLLWRGGITIYECTSYPSNIKSWLPYYYCRFKWSLINQLGVFKANSNVNSALENNLRGVNISKLLCWMNERYMGGLFIPRMNYHECKKVYYMRH